MLRDSALLLSTLLAVWTLFALGFSFSVVADFCLEFVVQLVAINRGAMGSPTDCRAAHPPERLSMRTADGRISWVRRRSRCRRRGAI
jgi:hypothetical protein